MKFKFRNFLIYVFLPLVLILSLSQSSFFQLYEYSFYDLALRLRAEQPQSEDIAIIEIDDATLRFLGEWPLPRDYHVLLVDILNEFGAKAIFFDLIFSESSTYDALLAESMEKAGNVYLPQVFAVNNDLPVSNAVLTDQAFLAPIAKTLGSGYRKGHINTIIDEDGKIRKTHLHVRGSNEFSPQLSLTLACDYLKLNCQNIQMYTDEIWIDHVLKIPVRDLNEILVNYPGRWQDTFVHYSYLDILKTYDQYKNEGAKAGLLDQLKGKVFFVGLTAAGTVDLRANPIENNYPMLGLNASLFNSFIQKDFIRALSKNDAALLNVVIFLISLWFAIRFKPMGSLFGHVLFAFVYLIVAFILLQHFGLWVPMFQPVFILTTVYLVSASMRWFKEDRQRRVFEKELLIAHDIQSQFLVSVDRDFKEFDAAVWFKPAKYVAGDLYDIFEIDENRFGVFIGDVSGKGLPAALLMAQAISLFRIFSRKLKEPYEVLIDLNQTLAERSTGRFLTGLYCIVNRSNSRLQIASAGHEPLLVYRHKTKQLEEISLPPRTPLGVMEDTEYQNIYASIERGDQLILVSDGVFEAHNQKGEELGIEQVKEIIRQNAGKSAGDLLGCIKEKLLSFTRSQEQFDDITIIVLSV